MSGRINRGDGLFARKIDAERWRWRCTVCEPVAVQKNKSYRISTDVDLAEHWAEHAASLRHQAKMGGISDEVFQHAAESVELAQKRKALERLRRR